MNNKRPSANTECPYCGAPGHTWDSYCCTEHYTQPSANTECPYCVENRPPGKLPFWAGLVIGLWFGLWFGFLIGAWVYNINSKPCPGSAQEVSILDQVAHE